MPSGMRFLGGAPSEGPACSRQESSTHRSSWAMPRWMAMAGKFCSTSSWARAMQRCTDFTKITTCRGRQRSQGPGSPRTSQRPRTLKIGDGSVT